MNAYRISANQLVVFAESSPSEKKQIINFQLNPPVNKISRYQKAKAAIRSAFKSNGDRAPIKEAIEFLKSKETTNSRQASDKTLSIQALERFLKMKYPDALKALKTEIVRSKISDLTIEEVQITVAPEIIFRAIRNGKKVLGGIKIHFSKDSQFSYGQAENAAKLVQLYLQRKVADKSEEVPQDLCFCLDVFAGKMISADNEKQILPKLKRWASEIKALWDKVIHVEIHEVKPDNTALASILKLAIGKPKIESLAATKDGSLLLRFWPGSFWEARPLLQRGGIKFDIVQGE